jgi:hypothetical protein
VSWHIYVSSKFDIQNHLLSIGAGMKKLRIKLAVAAVIGAFSITPAMSAQLELDSTGKVLKGIKGVQVGALYYDVSFGDTAPTPGEQFVFNTMESAIEATAALFRHFDVDQVAEKWGDKDEVNNGWYVNGVVDAASGFSVVSNYDGVGGVAFNNQRIGVIGLGGERVEALGLSNPIFLSTVKFEEWRDVTRGRWVSAQSPQPPNDVPEPTALTLLGIGVLGYAASRRKSKYPTQPDTMPTTA